MATVKESIDFNIVKYMSDEDRRLLFELGQSYSKDETEYSHLLTKYFQKDDLIYFDYKTSTSEFMWYHGFEIRSGLSLVNYYRFQEDGEKWYSGRDAYHFLERAVNFTRTTKLKVELWKGLVKS